MSLYGLFFSRGNFLICLLVVFTLVSGFYFYFAGRVSPVKDVIRRNQEISVLFVVHKNQKPLLISYHMQNTRTKRGMLFDIPANTAVTISSLGRIDRLDKVFNDRSPQEFNSYIAKLFYLTEIPFYIFIELENLSFFVDFIRGVELFVTSELNRVQDGEHLSIPSGSVLLDGAKVREYLILREEHENNTRWADRRQNFFLALIRRFVHQADIITHSRVIKHLHQRLQTNMSVNDMKLFWKELAFLDTENMGYQRFVGSARMVDESLLLFPADNQLLHEKIKQVSIDLANEGVGNILFSSKIEIQNGTSRNGLGSRTAQIFNSMGYDVITVRNASETAAYTVVIDLNNNIEVAQKVANIIRAKRIYSLNLSDNGDTEVHAGGDVRVILGNDFDGRYVQNFD